MTIKSRLAALENKITPDHQSRAERIQRAMKIIFPDGKPETAITTGGIAYRLRAAIAAAEARLEGANGDKH